jgi:exodeoxyribonuclease VIII
MQQFAERTDWPTRRVPNEPDDVYFQKALDVATNSGLKVIEAESPMGYHYYITNEDDEESTAAKDFGRAFHTSVLEPHKFFSTYCVVPPEAPKKPTAAQWNAKKPSPDSMAAMDWWRQWMGDNQGKLILSAKDYDMAIGMGNSARSAIWELPDGDGGIITIPGGELIDMCEKEVTYYWTDPRTGIKCKCRVDLDCEELSFGGDLKSCMSAHPETFARTMTTYRYHQQHAHYCDGRRIVTGRPYKAFPFFAVAKRKPYVPGLYCVNVIGEERGFARRDHAMDLLAECLANDRWPPYRKRMTELALPAYEMYDSPQE